MVHYLGALQSRLAVGGATVQVAALQSRIRSRSATNRGAVVAALRSGFYMVAAKTLSSVAAIAMLPHAAILTATGGHCLRSISITDINSVLLVFNVTNFNTVFQNTKFFTYTFRKF